VTAPPGQWAGGALKARSGGSDARPAMKARLWIAAIAVVAVIAAVVVGGAGAGSRGGALDPVAQAAETTMRAGGAQMSMRGSVSVAGAPGAITLSGQGSFNFAADEGTLTMAMGGLPQSLAARLHGAPLQITELFKANALYMGSPLFDGRLPGGARWMRLDLARFQRALGLDPGSLTNGGANPAQYLEYLKAAGAVTAVVGRERVRGVPTTHYSARIDLLKAAEAGPGSDRSQVRSTFEKLIARTGVRTLPVGVWIDRQGLVRKVAIELAMTTAGQRATASVVTEYHDFGPTPSISVPGGAEVYDLTDQALQSLSPAG